MNELPGDDAALAATPGASLAAARQARGLSVLDVATQMRISPRQVEAIEADRYHELPGDVFVRGFIRNYARLLQLDPVPLLHALEPALTREVSLKAHEIAGTLPTGRRSRKGAWIAALVALVAGLLLAAIGYEWWRSSSVAPFATPGTPAPGAAPVAPFPPPDAVGPATQTIPLAPQTVPDTPQTVPDTPQTVPDTPQPTPPASPPAAAVEPQAKPQPEPQGLVAPPSAATEATAQELAPAAPLGKIDVVFEGNSWLEIRDRDGRLVYMGTEPAGSTRRFEGRPPLAVVVGNAAGVRIAYNEKPFDLASHSARNIARFTLE